MTAMTKVVATSTSGASGKIQLAWSGRVRSRRASLRRSSRGWRIGGPARPSRRQRTLRISPTSSGPPITTPSTWSSETATTETTGQPASSDHHQHHDEGHQPEGQVAVHAPVRHPPGEGPPPVEAHGRRAIGVALEGVVERGVERAAST